MAIPLQMEFFRNSWSLHTKSARRGFVRSAHMKE